MAERASSNEVAAGAEALLATTGTATSSTAPPQPVSAAPVFVGEYIRYRKTLDYSYHRLDDEDRQRLQVSSSMRAAPLVGAKEKITVKNAVCPSLPSAAFGVFDCDFGFPSHELSCSELG